MKLNDPVVEMAGYTAFPSGPDDTHGLTIRDYFAAMALQGLVAARHEQYEEATLINAAVLYADGLIAALCSRDPK